jgi:hypothetical protein
VLRPILDKLCAGRIAPSPPECFRHAVFTSKFLMNIVDTIITCYLVFFIIRRRSQAGRVRVGAA